MKIDAFVPDREILEILKKLDVNPKKIKRVRQFTVSTIQVKYKDGHIDNFVINKEEKKYGKG